MNRLDLIPQRCVLDDLCSRFESVIRIGPLTPSREANKRMVRKSIRLQLRTHLSNPIVVQGMRENIPLISNQRLEDQDIDYWRRLAEMEHWENDCTDIDADDAVLFAKFEEIASQSILAALRGG